MHHYIIVVFDIFFFFFCKKGIIIIIATFVRCLSRSALLNPYTPIRLCYPYKLNEDTLTI